MKRAIALLLAIAIVLSVSLTAFASGVPKSVIDAKRGVVKIYTYFEEDIFSGTGFVIDSDDSGCVIVTNYHVIEGGQESIMYFDGQGPYYLDVLVSSPGQDLSILKTDRKVSGVTPLRLETGSIESGDAVFALGYPAAADYFASEGMALTLEEMTLTNGIVSAIQTSGSIGNQTLKVKLIQTNADINGGNSGGPMLSARGRVIGVNTIKIADAETSGINGAVHLSELKSFLDSERIPYNKMQINLTLIVVVAVSLFMFAVIAALVIQVIRLSRKLHKVDAAAPTEPIAPAMPSYPTEPITPTEPIVVVEPPAPKPRNPRRLALTVTLAAAMVLLAVSGTVVGLMMAQRNALVGEFEQAVASQNYRRAMGLLGDEPWLEARTDAKLKSYCEAMLLVQQLEVEKAGTIFEQLGSYRDCEEQAKLAKKYVTAKALDPLSGYRHFVALGNYADSPQRAAAKQEEIYQTAVAAFDKGNFTQARVCFDELPEDYADDMREKYGITKQIQNLPTADETRESAQALNLTRTADQQNYSALKNYILDNHLRAFLHGKWEDTRTGNYFYYSYLEKRFECSFNISSRGAYFYRYSASAKQQSDEIYISYKTADSITIYYRNRSFDMRRVY